MKQINADANIRAQYHFESRKVGIKSKNGEKAVKSSDGSWLDIFRD